MTISLLIFLLFTVAIPFISFKLSSGKKDRDKSGVVVIAHRGASGHAPENTLASFSKALEMGTDMIEIDLHLSADDSVMVMHDAKVDRTTNGHGEIRNMTCEQLKQLDAGGWFGDQFKGEKIPTLSEVLRLVDGKARVLIELKSSGAGLYQDLVAKTMEIVDANNARDWVILQSFDAEYFSEGNRKLLGGIAYQQLIFGEARGIPFYFDNKPRIGTFKPLPGASSVNLFYLYISPSFVSRMHLQQKTVYVFTPNDESSIGKSINLGADGVITNYPDIALKLLGRN